VNWLRRVLNHFGLAKPDPVIDRADAVIKNVDSLKVTVVPKNARALAELRRLNVRR
jgi:hypothetical protein